MQQTPFYHAAYFDETLVSPIGLAALLILCALQLSVPRRLAIVPFLLLICFVPCSQRVSIAGMDFSFLRILILCTWLRILSRGEMRGCRLTKLDKIILGWAVVETIAYVLLRRNFGAVVHMGGQIIETVGGYFLVRVLVRELDDLKSIAKAAAFIAVPVAICFAYEKATGRNMFSVFGGVAPITVMRQGKLRAAGAIGNPILAGCFFAALLPYIGALWWSRIRGARTATIVGTLGSLVVIVACASSTPLGAVAAGMLGAYMFQYRNQMSSVRWAIVAGLGAIQLMMNRPIWHLITRIDLVGGSTGYYRFLLIDAWIHNVTDWFLIGVMSTGGWGYRMEDIPNQYVLESVRGGMGAFVLFMASIVVTFQYVGRLMRTVAGDREHETLVWSIGVAVFVQCMSFIAVAYFAQVVFSWSLSLGIAGGLMGWLSTSDVRTPAAVPVAVSRPSRPVPRRRRARLLGEAP